MGTLFGYHLAQTCDVTILDSNAEVLGAIARDGLCVNDGPPRRVTVTSHPRDLYSRRCSSCSSRRSTRCARSGRSPGSSTPRRPIVSLQNGVGNEAAIKTALGGAVPVILGITTESSLTVAPRPRTQLRAGQHHHRLDLGLARDRPHGGRHAHALAACAPRSSTTSGRICGETRRECGDQRHFRAAGLRSRSDPEDPNASHLAESLAEEVAAVAAALKINLPFVNPWQYVMQVISVGADSKSSMAFDLESGHPSEIDHINGAVVAFGRRPARRRRITTRWCAW